MVITSKGYTMAFFTRAIKSATAKTISNVGISGVLSPKGGTTSVKVQTLNGFLGGSLSAIENGKGRFAGFGKTSRSRVLKALSLRKKNGTV